jgi:hexosaminidase
VNAIVPNPAVMRETAGGAELSNGMLIASEEACAGEGDLLASELEAATGWRLQRSGDIASPQATVRLRLDERLEAEAYRLRIGQGTVEIFGGSPAGVFYGTRTLRQLLPVELLRSAPAGRPGPVPLDGLEVEDSARFGWRGVLVDVARHYFPKHFLLRLVDLMSLHKLNVLHLHLTDDQGWRVQIDRYPRLTEVGAWRRESPLGHQREGTKDGKPHGGFYTKADLAELCAYASRRHVTVVPEVDMPGHTQAAIAAYPELGNSGQRLEVSTDWGISEHVLNMEESTADFCAAVLDEVMEVFSSPYVHIGGDGCPTTPWEASARARELIGQRGLASARALQGWFTARMADAVARRGRALVCWEEVLEAGAPPGAVIEPWRGHTAAAAAERAARAGHRVVMVPEPWCYFDWAYSDDPTEPLAIRPAISVEKAYSFEPVPTGFPAELMGSIAGAQCQLWTEYVASPEHAEYMLWPRACAFAEAAWTGPQRDWKSFEVRLSAHLRRLEAIGVNYRPLDGPTPGQARTWLLGRAGPSA